VSEKLKDAEYIIVTSEGHQIPLSEYVDDMWDDDTDAVFRRVAWQQDCVLDLSGYGPLIDQMISQARQEIDGKNVDDGFRLDIEVTVGDLRRLNLLAGMMQGQSRVRNPEIGRVLGMA